MDALGIYMEFPSKLDPFMNDDMKDLWDSDLDQVIFLAICSPLENNLDFPYYSSTV